MIYMNPKMKRILTIFFVILPFTAHGIEFDIKMLTNKEGLSNSSVNVIFQDSNQLMWFGTWDGLNLYNSREFQVFKPVPGNPLSISNNIIREVIEEKNGFLWIATDIGINRFNVREKVFERFFVDSLSRDITDERSYLIASDSKGNIIASVRQQGLFYFDSEKSQFMTLATDSKLNVKQLFFDTNDTLWVLTREKAVYTLDLKEVEGSLRVSEMNLFPLDGVENIFHPQSNKLYLQTSDCTTYLFDRVQNRLEELPFGSAVGPINQIALNKGSTYIATGQGLYLYGMNNELTPIIENTSVLSLFYNQSQNILWVGTDMKGIYRVIPHNEKFKTYSSANVPDFGSVAVRTFYEDEDKTLWVGTKGAGIYTFKRDAENGEWRPYNRYNTEDGLMSNSVFVIAKGFTNEHWIGTDGNGINYFDRESNAIRELVIPEELILSSIYAILPDQNHTLWIGTSGYGMYKLTIDVSTSPYRVTDYKQFVFDERSEEPTLTNNIVYSIVRDNDTHLWIGTRGGGVNRFDILNESFTAIKFSENNFSSNDVLCLHLDYKGNLWVGTSIGLKRLTWNGNDELDILEFNEKKGIPNNTIHGILEDANHNLWISTNYGLTKLGLDELDEDVYHISSYFVNDGLQDNEFSDGAYYSSPSSLFYFGGISGFNEFDPLEILHESYMPELWLDAFYVNNIATDLSDHVTLTKRGATLTLSYNCKSFSFRFIPIDYLASSRCEIAYLMEGFQDAWVNLGTSNTIVFTNIPKGNYTLKVKASNANLVWSEPLFSLPVVITPPWWKSNVAYIAYVIALLFLAATVRKMVLYRMKLNNDLKMKELEKQKVEEIHQAKLSFFTNIAHEFSNSLTLIYGPCDKLIKENEADNKTKRYLQVIKSNSERMQNLIEQLVEFRKAETGHLNLNVDLIDIPELIKYVMDNFVEVIEQKKIDYSVTFNPDENITWKTDRDNLEKIIFNLFSNAVKYTPEKERIEVNVNVLGDNRLNISVKNTGIGIKPEYFSTLFDRFEVLNQIEKQASTGNYPRHGIGLALCKSIANILQGDIQLRSDGTTFTLFEVSLPNLELTASGTVPEDHQDDFTHPPGPVMPTPAEATPGIEAKTKETIPNIPDNPFILVVEDDAEIRFMIKDLLSSDYQIVEASNGKEGLQVVNQKHPLLIISDIIMPEMDGVEFVKVMKADEFTSHIPIILLSSKSSIDNQIEGFESGADAYINKPFNFRHLEVMIKNLLHKKEILKEYGTSPYSALEQYEGSLIHKEDKDLILHITQIIHDNIDSEELTIDFIANETAVSKIQLYRKIKEITKKTPTEFIRAIRLKHASKLLKTTNKTVQEVLYDSGFNNKAYFYREFFKQYNMTPKEYRESVDLSLPRD